MFKETYIFRYWQGYYFRYFVITNDFIYVGDRSLKSLYRKIFLFLSCAGIL